MFANHLVLALVLGMLPAVVFAGPAEDARLIAERHVVCDGAARKLAALEQALFNKLEPGIGKLGATIRDPDRFMRELWGGFSDAFLPDLVGSLTQAYGVAMSPRELSDLAGFYRSAEGEEPPGCAPMAAADVDGDGFWTDGPGAPILQRLPQIQAEMDRFTSESLSVIQSTFTIDRMAEILADPEIIGFEDEALRARVVASMRRRGN